MDVERIYFWKGKRDTDFISLVAVGGDSCFVCQTFLISSEVWIAKIGISFPRIFVLSLAFKIISDKGSYVWKRKANIKYFLCFCFESSESFLYVLVLGDSCVLMLAGLAVWWAIGHRLLC